VQALIGVEVNSSVNASFFSSAFINQNCLNIKKKKEFPFVDCYHKNFKSLVTSPFVIEK
jgi:hypothetical protein